MLDGLSPSPAALQDAQDYVDGRRTLEELIEAGFTSGTGQGLHPVIGPSVDPLAMEEALRALAPEEFGWMHSVGRTTSPYR